MGRAGRGGGGGGRSHSSGGSRGFGSHSSGGSHRSGYSGGSRSNYSSGSHTYHTHTHYHGGYYSPYYRRYSRGPTFFYFGNGGDSGLRFFLTFRIIFFLVILFMFSGIFSGINSEKSSITRSTVKREKLKSTAIVENDVYYIDRLGWITDKYTLIGGLDHFYKKTGVQPFVYITDELPENSTLDEQEYYGNQLYDQLFEDEAHLLLVFNERNDVYTSFYIVGAEGKTVIDNEAGEILLDYLDKYYYSDYDENKFFSNAFYDAADRIMKVTPNYTVLFVFAVLIIIVLIIAYKWHKSKEKAKSEQMKAASEILNSDLDEFGDYAEELAKKYDDK